MATTRYAEGTTVAPETTQLEIRRLLAKHNAQGFGFLEMGRRARIEFVFGDRRIRFEVRLPDPEGDEFRYVGKTYRRRTAIQQRAAWQAEVRRLWRVLLLTLKSKLEIVSSGQVSMEEEFLAHIVVGGETVGALLVPQLEMAQRQGYMPTLLPSGRE